MKQKIIIAVGPGQAAVLLPKYIVKPFLDDLCQPFSLLRLLIVKDLAAGNLLLVIAVLMNADRQQWFLFINLLYSHFHITDFSFFSTIF